MTPPVLLFFTLTTLLASALVLYVANVRLVFRESGNQRGMLSLVPLATPVLAFQAGGQAIAVAFAFTATLYVLIAMAADA